MRCDVVAFSVEISCAALTLVSQLVVDMVSCHPEVRSAATTSTCRSVLQTTCFQLFDLTVVLLAAL